MKMHKPQISFCMPLYNEFESIIDYLEEIRIGMLSREETYEFSICDDTGFQGFELLLREYFSNNEISFCYHGWEKNYGAAISLYRSVKQSNGDKAVLIDGDAQFSFWT